jgi:tetratricopeptide (TPR) repeat protein
MESPAAPGVARPSARLLGRLRRFRQAEPARGKRRRGPSRLVVVLLAASLVSCTGGSPGWREGGLANAEEFGQGRSAAAAYLAGRHALELGRVEEAARYFERAAAADPLNLELRRQAFLLTVAAGEIDRGIALARQLLELDGAIEEARLLLAVVEAKAGRYQAMREQVARLGGRGPLGGVAPALRAWARAGTGDLDAALELLERGGRDDPFALLRGYHRAMILAYGGRLAEARAALAALEKGDEPLPVRVLFAQAALDVRAGERERALSRIDAYRKRAGDPASLAAIRERIVRGEEGWLPAADPASGAADLLLGLADLLREQRVGAQALLYARLAAHLTPDAGDVWLAIGRIAQLQDDHAAAIRAYERVRENSPFYWEAQLAKASALKDQDKAEEAIALLRDLARRRPERIDALVELGDLLRAAERFAEAGEAYGEAIARIGTPERQHWRLFYVRGIALERTKRWPEAEAAFLKALELQPDQPFVLNYLGYSWVDQGVNLERAKAMLHRAVELRPQDGFIVDSLGWAYFKLGEWDKAVEYLERAVELEPGDPTINDHLGDAYWRVGRHREARFQWQRALGLKPEADALAAINEKLEKGLPEPDARRG